MIVQTVGWSWFGPGFPYFPKRGFPESGSFGQGIAAHQRPQLIPGTRLEVTAAAKSQQQNCPVKFLAGCWYTGRASRDGFGQDGDSRFLGEMGRPEPPPGDLGRTRLLFRRRQVGAHIFSPSGGGGVSLIFRPGRRNFPSRQSSAWRCDTMVSVPQ